MKFTEGQLAHLRQYLTEVNTPYVGSIINIIKDRPEEAKDLLYIRGITVYNKALRFFEEIEDYDICNTMKQVIQEKDDWVEGIIKGLKKK